MKHFFTTFFLLSLFFSLAQSDNENYVKTIEPKAGYNISELDNLLGNSSTPNTLSLNLPVTSGDYIATERINLTDGFHATGTVRARIVDFNENLLEYISYYDGLGRPIQNIARGQSANGNDIIRLTDYDQFGRESSTYLPFSVQQNSGNAIDNPVNEQVNYYRAAYDDPYGLSFNKYDESPLNRVVESSSPGTDFRILSGNVNGHTVKYEYGTNLSTTEVIKFSIDDSGSSPLIIKGSYDTKELLKNTIKNENWQLGDGSLNTVETYSDKSDRTIAQITYEEGPNGTSVKRITQNIYDIYGRLRYVLPPKSLVNVTTTPGNFQINENLVFQYRYDQYNRKIAQRVPGRGWEYMVYDRLDRPVLTQDANLKADNKWLFTKYDVFGRPIYSGIYVSSQTPEQLQQSIDSYIQGNTSNLANAEKRTTTSIEVGGLLMSYSNNAFPIDNISEVLTLQYYDDYLFTDNDKPTGLSSNVQGQTVTNRTKGLLTASFTKTLGESTWNKTYSYYDSKGRAIRIYSKNHQGGHTISSSKLDFRGKTIQSYTRHKKNSSATVLNITNRFTFDHAERVLGQYQKINAQPEERLAENTYDELGMLIGKQVGGTTGSIALQEHAYKYNIRGQISSLNDVSNLGNKLFAYKLRYNETSEGGSPVASRYDGSISQAIWRSSYDNTKKSYSYSYDALNRLKSSSYQYNENLNGNSGLNYNTQITYDPNGNIVSLNRNDGNGVMDQLSYDYGGANGNQLFAVSDTYASVGFIDGNTSGNDYAYDGNGNLIKDLNKGISSITYNHLDLVKNVSLASNRSLSFMYSATGEKLQKKYKNGNTIVADTEYLNGFQYVNGTLQFFPTTQGYVYKSGNTYKYMYIYRDHLGNNRVSYSDVDENGNIAVSELNSNTNYYPFGASHSEQFTGSLAANYNYVFQGKEYQAENGLNWHDFGSRNYDAYLGRWMVPDPQNQFGSPYLAMGNNPISFTDPDGEYTGWDDAAAFLIGGIINVVANYDNIDDWGDGLSYFGIGGVSGVATLYGGPVAGGAILAGGNSFYTQYDKNNGNVEVDQLLFDTTIGAATAGIGSKLSPFIATHTSKLFGSSSSLFSQYAVDAVSNVSSGVIIETTVGVAMGESLNDSFSNSLNNIPQSLVISGISTTGAYYKGKHQARQEAKKQKLLAQENNEVVELNIPAIELTTSSESLKPSRNYTIFLEDGTVYKFGVSGADLKRYNQSLIEAGPNAFGKYSDIKPKFKAHISEKYMRSLHYNTTGDYFLPGMKIPFPVDFDTRMPIKLN